MAVCPPLRGGVKGLVTLKKTTTYVVMTSSYVLYIENKYYMYLFSMVMYCSRLFVIICYVSGTIIVTAYGSNLIARLRDRTL